MKKLFTCVLLTASSIAAMAADYTEQLTVNLNGMQIADNISTISVDKQDDGNYTLRLNNFALNESMPVGNIVVPDVAGIENGSSMTLISDQTVSITAGDLPGVGSGDYLGPQLGPVPVVVKAEVRDEKLFAIIDINLPGMMIKVTFGNGGYQIGNSGFETFHLATIANPNKPESVSTSDEPDHWHSFMTASSYQDDGTENPSIAYLAGFAPHTFISDATRPGSAGKHSVLLTSSDMGFLGVANGTITTGRLNAGNVSAANKLNHSWSDMSKTELDPNGDPFYTEVNGLPDSVAVWVKFKQLKPSADHPYATINAVLTDGTYYQDPEEKEYTNVMAKATDAKIESKDFVWQRLAIPFEYTGYSAPKKVMHVTISTNADAGKGSTDSLYVDDFELIYNSKLESLKVKGAGVAGFSKDVTSYNVEVAGAITADDIEASADGTGAIVTKKDVDGTGKTFEVRVTSNDLQTSTVYTLNIQVADGISSVTGSPDNTVEAMYNLNGQRIGSASKGQVYIRKYADGKTVKAIKK